MGYFVPVTSHGELQVKLVKGKFKNPLNGTVESAKQVSKIFQNIKDYSQETLIGLYLKDDLKPITYSVLSLGDDSATLCSTRHILKQAILLDSNFFILIHNHPEGDPEPSQADKQMMFEVQRAGQPLGFYMLDFIVMGDLGDRKVDYWSLFNKSTSRRSYGKGKNSISKIVRDFHEKSSSLVALSS